MLVHGSSGTGKSSIVETLRHYATQDDWGYFVSGKLDQLRGNDPYSAIVEAFTGDLIDVILQGGDLEKIRYNIRDELQTDVPMFAQLVANLTLLDSALCVDFMLQPIEKVRQYFVRFKLACRSFLRAVASVEHPVVIFIDDLQFAADEASLKVMEAIMTDPESKNVLIVTAYRDGEKYIHRLLKNAIEVTNQRTKEKENVLRMTNIPVVNLEIDSTNDLISDALGMHLQTTMPLTPPVLRKTHGNVNHILRCLEFLQFEQLLTPPMNDGARQIGSGTSSALRSKHLSLTTSLTF